MNEMGLRNLGVGGISSVMWFSVRLTNLFRQPIISNFFVRAVKPIKRRLVKSVKRQSVKIG